ncbi:hypothetical protein BT69DRAFT_1345648, partial [Atractiella rhizophila]
MTQRVRNASKTTTTPFTNQSKIILQYCPNAPPTAVQRLPNASTSLQQSSSNAPTTSAEYPSNATKPLSRGHIFVVRTLLELWT